MREVLVLAEELLGELPRADRSTRPGGGRPVVPDGDAAFAEEPPEAMGCLDGLGHFHSPDGDERNSVDGPDAGMFALVRPHVDEFERGE